MFFFSKNKTRKKKFVVCANCQGDALLYLLKKIPLFKERYDTYTITNYILIRNKLDIPEKKIREADVFLYQPIDPIHGKYSTRSISELLKEDCISISFPYIYNNGFWPFYLDHDNGDKNQVGIDTLTFFDSNVIHEMVESGMSTEDIIASYDNNSIPFNFENKFNRSLEILRNKEVELDVRVATFIEENYKNKRLFYNFQHPTVPVLLHALKQILVKIGIEYNVDSLSVEKYLYDSKFLPILDQVKNELGLSYFDEDSEEYFRNLLKEVVEIKQFNGFKHGSFIRKKFYEQYPPIRE